MTFTRFANWEPDREQGRLLKLFIIFFFLPFARKNETAVKSFRFVPIEINYDSRAPATRDGNVDVYVETRNKNLDEMYSDYEDQVSDFLEFFGIFLFLVLIYTIKLERNFRGSSGSRFWIESKLINGFAFFRDPRKYGLSAIPVGKFVSNDVLNGSIIQLPEILIIINSNIISPLMGFIEISFNEKLKKERESW